MAGVAPPVAAAVEPESVIDEPSIATTKPAIVSIRSRRGVSQPRWCACSHERTPLAPANAAIAHAPHMDGRLTAAYEAPVMPSGSAALPVKTWQVPRVELSCDRP